MTATPGTAWATCKASGTLPAAVLLACQQLDTHRQLLTEPLGGMVAKVMLDALLTVAG